jgi:hypothetical protein
VRRLALLLLELPLLPSESLRLRAARVPVGVSVEVPVPPLEVVAVVPLLRILLISLVVDAGEVGLEGVHPMVLLVVVVVTGNAVL